MSHYTQLKLGVNETLARLAPLPPASRSPPHSGAPSGRIGSSAHTPAVLNRLGCVRNSDRCRPRVRAHPGLGLHPKSDFRRLILHVPRWPRACLVHLLNVSRTHTIDRFPHFAARAGSPSKSPPSRGTGIRPP